MPYEKHETFRELLGRVTGSFPDNPAVFYEDVTLSYKELFDRANRVACGLCKLGVRKEDKVCVWMPNVPEWVISWWGIPMLGATFVPIDHWYKVVEAEHIANHSDAVALLVYHNFRTWNFLDILKEVKAEKLKHIIVVGSEDEAKEVGGITFDQLLEMGKDWADDQEYLNETKKVKPDDVAAILYTSGTTGNPKGVMLSHYQIIKNAYDQGERMEISEKDRLVVPVPFSHCFGCVMSITMLGSVGGAIAPLIAFDERDALETVQRYKCTMIHGTPTMFLRELKLFRSEKFDTSSLRTGIMAGAHCPEDLMRAVTEEMGPNLCITYGLTEASPGITMTSLNDSIKDKVNTVGKPLPDIEAKIVDDNGREVLPGTVGEIICKGYNVMKGYYKAPELTAEVIKDGWLYSGDLGFMDERGYITFKGRKKELVITGGFNVYPPDVERFIREFDKVLDVAIIGAPDEDLGEVVAAAVIPAEGVKLDPQEIVDFCYGKIASPKVPRYVYITDHFPLSGRGKVQKYKLVEEVKQLINEGKLKKIIPTAVKMRKEKAKNLLGNGSWKE